MFGGMGGLAGGVWMCECVVGVRDVGRREREREGVRACVNVFVCVCVCVSVRMRVGVRWAELQEQTMGDIPADEQQQSGAIPP